jgi:cyclic pyranopterin phosphate synthase
LFITDLLSKIGIRWIRITGGEPLLKKDLLKIISDLTCISTIKELSLTTNGIFLKKKAKLLKEAGIKRLNISIDTLQRKVFWQITKGDYLNDVLEGIEAAKKAGFEEIKTNTVVMRNINYHEIPKIANFAWSQGIIPRFIELMNINNSIFKQEVVSGVEIIAKLKQEYGSKVIFKDEHSKNGRGPAKYYCILPQGQVFGIISPSSQGFCQTCNRIRLSLGGRLWPCLFSFESSCNLRELIQERKSDELREKIYGLISKKGLYKKTSKVSLNIIGG